MVFTCSVNSFLSLPQSIYGSFFNGINRDSVFPLVNNDDSNLKLNEDRYEVYVNDHFVGHKTLKNPGEKLSNIDGFLNNQGLSDFSTSLDGDHYQIKTNDQDDITNALSVYFNNW